MPFFKPTPNLPADARARIEFHLQQIAECIGFNRLTLPVLSAAQLVGQESIVQSTGRVISATDSQLTSQSSPATQTVEQIKSLVGERLAFDYSGVQIQTFPMQPEKTGGGG